MGLSINKKKPVEILFEKTALPPDNEEPAIRCMRGNLSSRTLLIGPPPSDEEYSLGVPLSGAHAGVFHKLLLSAALVSTQRDCLVIPCCLYGKKPLAGNTAPVLEFVKQSARMDLFDHYAIIGSAAFKFIFGHGKLPTMSSLVGQTMYIRDVNNKPVFVFGDIEPLIYRETADKRTNFGLQRKMEETTNQLLEDAKKFKELIKS